mgnify:CR=1 FL=1
MEKTPFRKTSQEDTKKEKLVTLSERDSLVIEAAIEFGADYFYEVKNGTLGITLYITAPNKTEASLVRKDAPGNWRGLYVIVLYNSSRDFEDELLYDPKLS